MKTLPANGAALVAAREAKERLAAATPLIKAGNKLEAEIAAYIREPTWLRSESLALAIKGWRAAVQKIRGEG